MLEAKTSYTWVLLIPLLETCPVDCLPISEAQNWSCIRVSAAAGRGSICLARRHRSAVQQRVLKYTDSIHSNDSEDLTYSQALFQKTSSKVMMERQTIHGGVRGSLPATCTSSSFENWTGGRRRKTVNFNIFCWQSWNPYFECLPSLSAMVHSYYLVRIHQVITIGVDHMHRMLRMDASKTRPSRNLGFSRLQQIRPN